MCERPAAGSSVSEEKNLPKNGPSKKNDGTLTKKAGETLEEKRQRRRAEKKEFARRKKQAAGKLIPTKLAPKRVVALFNQVWTSESSFVTEAMECLPESKNPDLYLLSEERAEEYLATEIGGDDELNERAKTQKFFARVRKKLEAEGVQPTERTTSYQELRERLHKKIAELAEKPNEQKRAKKLKKKLAHAEEVKSNKGKKLISQTAAAAADSTSVKTETEPSATKTPLQKKPVVKANGEIVYSKFDFISKKASRSITTTPSLASPSAVQGTAEKNKSGKKGAAKHSTEDLLKQAEKHERQISMLATQGKKSEAASLAETQKWTTALKRADGVKVRDDPYLLKKSMKKLEKQKQLTKKKWKERVERVEQMKEQRQQKRQTNIQSRKDEKKKRVKKQLRKKGRIA